MTERPGLRLLTGALGEAATVGVLAGLAMHANGANIVQSVGTGLAAAVSTPFAMNAVRSFARSPS